MLSRPAQNHVQNAPWTRPASAPEAQEQSLLTSRYLPSLHPANLPVSRRSRLHRSAAALTYDEVDLLAPLLLQIVEREVRQRERRIAIAGPAVRCLAMLTTCAHAPVRHPIVPRAWPCLLGFPPVARRLLRCVLLVVRVWVHIGDMQEPALQLPLRICAVNDQPAIHRARRGDVRSSGACIGICDGAARTSGA